MLVTRQFLKIMNAGIKAVFHIMHNAGHKAMSKSVDIQTMPKSTKIYSIMLTGNTLHNTRKPGPI